MNPVISPDQVKWIVDHNEQILGSHRVQLLDASQAWAEDRERLTLAEAKLAEIASGDPSSLVLTFDTTNYRGQIYVGWQWLVVLAIIGALAVLL